MTELERRIHRVVLDELDSDILGTVNHKPVWRRLRMKRLVWRFRKPVDHRLKVGNLQCDVIDGGAGARSGGRFSAEENRDSQRADTIERPQTAGRHSNYLHPERNSDIRVGGVEMDVGRGNVRSA